MIFAAPRFRDGGWRHCQDVAGKSGFFASHLCSVDPAGYQHRCSGPTPPIRMSGCRRSATDPWLRLTSACGRQSQAIGSSKIKASHRKVRRRTTSI